ILHSRKSLELEGQTKRRIGLTIVAAGIMGGVVWLLGQGVVFPHNFWARSVWLGGMVMAGAGVYAVLLHMLGLADLARIVARLRSKLGR
ncbi:MAG: hypothetical protein ABF467_11405, partial [Acetobacter orientalis]